VPGEELADGVTLELVTRCIAWDTGGKKGWFCLVGRVEGDGDAGCEWKPVPGLLALFFLVGRCGGWE